MDKQYCLDCGEEIDVLVDKCPYCGFDYIEFYKSKKITKTNKKSSTKANKKARMFTDEEILALGLYPKDECYKMSLISRILGKR